MGIVVIGAVFVDIKGYPLSTYMCDTKSLNSTVWQ